MSEAHPYEERPYKQAKTTGDWKKTKCRLDL